MSSEANQNISLNTNKLNEYVYDTYSRNLLFKFTRSNDITGNSLKEIAGITSGDIEKDTYGNLKYKYLAIKVNKTPSRLNVLKLFKPGEFLNFILTH